MSSFGRSFFLCVLISNLVSVLIGLAVYAAPDWRTDLAYAFNRPDQPNRPDEKPYRDPNCEGCIDPKYLVIKKNPMEDAPLPLRMFESNEFDLQGLTTKKGQRILMKVKVDPKTLCAQKIQKKTKSALLDKYCADAKSGKIKREEFFLPVGTGSLVRNTYGPVHAGATSATSYTDDEVIEIASTRNIKDPRYKDLISKTAYMAVISGLAIRGMMELPKSETNWEQTQFKDKNFVERWNEHVKEGPVWDKDSNVTNYIYHPLSGAGYYTMARNSGLSAGESFIYSFLMSTFVWEYGVEATAEAPSIQDLIFTPTLGALIGEGAYQLIQLIDDNDGKVLGSRTLGAITKAVLAPFDFMVTQLRSVLDPILEPVFGPLNISASIYYHRMDTFDSKNSNYETPQIIGIRLTAPLPVGWDLKLLGYR